MKKLLAALVLAVIAVPQGAAADSGESPLDSVPVINARHMSDEAAAVLQDLAGRQSREAITEAMNSGRHVEILIDAESGDVLSAVFLGSVLGLVD